MSRPPYRPLNLSQVEIEALIVLLDDALNQVTFNVKSKIGNTLLSHLATKTKRLKHD
jgi:hypothetical protein